MLNMPRFALAARGDLGREMNRLFDTVAREFAAPTFAVYPALNIWEDGDRLVAEAEVPGLRLEDLEITIEGDALSLKGRRVVNAENTTFHRQERMVGEFSRVIQLPAEVDAERVDAVLKDGVLRIEMPKAEHARARRIAVRGS